MKFYFAPMEGVTGYIYRNAYNKYFNSMDKYFAPFIVADQTDGFKSRDRNDILPENNQSLFLIPQILTNNAKDFQYTSRKIQQYGYDEINLNLGCPSGTVVSKNRGSGFLALKDALNTFLEEIYSQQETKISVKTRLGKENPEEFYELIQIYNQYPIHELIIHPRVQKDMYKNTPNMAVFKDALSVSKNPVCYNGDLFTLEAYQSFVEAFPEIDRVMIGRGLITNPGLVGQIKTTEPMDKVRLRAFHDEVLNDYLTVMFGDVNILYKMKEVWFYMGQGFTEREKYIKKIMKAVKLNDYVHAVDKLFNEQELRETITYSPYKWHKE